nr:hypothetical protein Iba_chr03cCG11170 [Ipomoea batatas]
MPAARAAEAFVSLKTSEKCSTAPAPLLAITGMLTASDINLISRCSLAVFHQLPILQQLLQAQMLQLVYLLVHHSP